MSDRMTNFTRPEQKTMMTLWSIFQSPLMFGGELADLDEWTLGLLTNAELTHMHSTLVSRKQVFRDDTWVIWFGENRVDQYIAIFNVSDDSQRIPEVLIDRYIVSDDAIELWSGLSKNQFDRNLAPHDCVIIKKTPSWKKGLTVRLRPLHKIMQDAEMLLRNPADNISEIATLCGIVSLSNFAKIFKRFYNCTPRKHRNLNRNRK